MPVPPARATFAARRNSFWQDDKADIVVASTSHGLGADPPDRLPSHVF
jgi:hypothetical protein